MLSRSLGCRGSRRQSRRPSATASPAACQPAPASSAAAAPSPGAATSRASAPALGGASASTAASSLRPMPRFRWAAATARSATISDRPARPAPGRPGHPLPDPGRHRERPPVAGGRRRWRAGPPPRDRAGRSRRALTSIPPRPDHRRARRGRRRRSAPSCGRASGAARGPVEGHRLAPRRECGQRPRAGAASGATSWARVTWGTYGVRLGPVQRRARRHRLAQARGARRGRAPPTARWTVGVTGANDVGRTELEGER